MLDSIWAETFKNIPEKLKKVDITSTTTEGFGKDEDIITKIHWECSQAGTSYWQKMLDFTPYLGRFPAS